MRLSISVTNYSWPGGPTRLADELARLGQTADRIGVDTLWVVDHLIQADPTAPPDDRDMYEAYTVLGYLAARTERVRIGTMVTGVTFRPPALLIKAVTSVDALSGGRAWLGIGAGHHDGEARAMALPFPPAGDRLDQLEETLQIALRMWEGDETPYHGKHFTLERPDVHPDPVHRPHPPILVGGAGERRTLSLVARYADACNVFDIPDGGQTVRRKLAVLARHCDEVGRPYGEISKTLSSRLNPGESPDELVGRAEAAARLGIDHLILGHSTPWSPEALDTLAAAIPAINTLTP